MITKSLYTGAEITWCRNCGNFGILGALGGALNELTDDIPLENFVMVTGIGCHGKIFDYVDINSFYSLHGRAIATASGIKLANENLKVICFVGDGDGYGEGMEHLVFAAKRNIDITVIVHDNRSYSLTTGQFTPTSALDFRGKSTPKGPPEDPINPISFMLEAGATFIARGYSGYIDHLKDLIKKAVMHKGFSLVEVFQPCVIFYNTYDFYNAHVYKLENHDPTDYEKAYKVAKEWDYIKTDTKIPIGIIYENVSKKTYEERLT